MKDYKEIPEMIRLKEPTTKVFKRDFAYYLFGKVHEKLFIHYPLYVILGVYFILNFYYIYCKFHPAYLYVPIVFLSIIWIVFSLFMRQKALCNLGYKAKDHENRILQFNYNDAIEEKIFSGEKSDLQVISNLLKQYNKDVESYNKRFIHGTTIIAVILSTFGFFFKDFFLEIIIDILKPHIKNQTDKIVFFVLGLILIALCIFAFYALIKFIYRKQGLSVKVYDKLIDLETHLLKRYKD